MQGGIFWSTANVSSGSEDMIKLLSATALLCCAILALLALVVDGLAFDFEKALGVLESTNARSWLKVWWMGLAGTAMSLLLAAHQRPRTAVVAIISCWLPATMSAFTLMTAAVLESSSRDAVGVAVVLCLGICLSTTVLFSISTVRGYRWAHSRVLPDGRARNDAAG